MSDSFISGALAGTLTDLLLHPIDTIKTRLQSSPTSTSCKSPYTPRGIYKGIGPVVCASAPSAGTFFLTYDTLKRHLEHTTGKKGGAPIHLTASSVAEAVSCLVRVPFELVKQNAQNTSGSSLVTGGKIVKRGGIWAIWKGYSSLVARNVPFTIIHFPLYEHLRTTFALPPGVAGAISGATAALSTTPIDVIKTRIMVNGGSMWEVARGMRAGEMWRGGGIRVVVAGIGAGVYLGVYEAVKAIL